MLIYVKPESVVRLDNGDILGQSKANLWYSINYSVGGFPSQPDCNAEIRWSVPANEVYGE
tara:strand:- start:230 stop:409 length:180 start_codon:yes stop_codon:yes gene_type:complete